MDHQRVRPLRDGEESSGPVVYWMSRDQRVADNWALLYAQECARKKGVPLGVVFALVPGFLGATLRQYDFMLRGLEEVERSLAGHGIPFFLLPGKPQDVLPRFLGENRAALLVADFSPLRIPRSWKRAVARRIAIPFHEVDAHNIVPCWIASPKREFAAATFRPKIERWLPTFLEEIPKLRKHGSRPRAWKRTDGGRTDWDRVRGTLNVDRSVLPVDLLPGEAAAKRVLGEFLRRGLAEYAARRNDPTARAQSGLSPYLHFGQISAQRVALEVSKVGGGSDDRDAFLEELIVRRELSDNFCLYTPSYDSAEAFPVWARGTLDRHRSDRRDHTYTRGEFEQGRTHDALWNAAQKEMVVTGRMHGYLRMYWAKKILEWSPTPEGALRTAIYLNDRYQIDGRDPNGYTGIAWSIGGVHDRAWGEREVFGKIRYMSFEGCRRKFDVDAYIARVEGMS